MHLAVLYLVLQPQVMSSRQENGTRGNLVHWGFKQPDSFFHASEGNVTATVSISDMLSTKLAFIEIMLQNWCTILSFCIRNDLGMTYIRSKVLVSFTPMFKKIAPIRLPLKYLPLDMLDDNIKTTLSVGLHLNLTFLFTNQLWTDLQGKNYCVIYPNLYKNRWKLFVLLILTLLGATWV